MKIHQKIRQVIALFALGAVASLSNPARAESEPNDSAGAADTIGIPGNESGGIRNNEDDWFKIPNTTGYEKIKITVTFSGMGGGDTNDLTIRDDSQSPLFNHTFSQNGMQMYVIDPAAPGDTYYIELNGSSADGANQYTIAVTGSPDVITLRKIADYNKQIKKIKKRIRKAKKKQQKIKAKRLKKKLRKLKKLRLILQIRLEENP